MAPPPAVKPKNILDINFIYIIIFFIIFYLVFLNFFKNNDLFIKELIETSKNFILLLPEYFASLMLRLFSFSLILSSLLMIGIVIVANKLTKIRDKMSNELNLVKSIKADKPIISEIVNKKWQDVLTHINSDNPSDWKLAILECDIILGDILEKMGYTQESIGEKLKSIEVSDFTNIEAAWEAHKIRNMIAHEGSEFLINEREAKRVIGLYELVFKEFEFI